MDISGEGQSRPRHELPPLQPFGVMADTLAVSVRSLGAHATQPTRATLTLRDASPRVAPPRGPITNPTVLVDGIPLQDDVDIYDYQYYTINYILPVAGIEVTLASSAGDPGKWSRFSALFPHLFV